MNLRILACLGLSGIVCLALSVAAGQTPAGKRYAVLVGVKDYKHEKLPALRYSENDVVELGKMLREAGYAVTLLCDSAGTKDTKLAPNKANIERALKEVLGRCERGDTVIVAFAGHGVQFEKQKDAFFCPVDARPLASATASLVSLAKVYEELDGSFASVKVLLVDACRNDPGPEGGRSGIDADNAPRPPSGVAALFSCRAGEKAFEHAKYEHGVFFHHLLQGLKGEAKNTKGNVTFHSLAEYVQYQVLVDPDKLQEYNVSLQEIETAIKANNLNASGGFIEESQTERPVRVIGRLGPLPAQVVDDLLKVPVKVNADRAVLLGKLARIEPGPAPKRGDASIDGSPGVVLTVVKQPHADTRGLTERVKTALREAESSLPADVIVNTDLFQLKSFIDRGVYYVEEALVIGAVLVVIVLFLFLLNVRTTLITLTAIPLSLVVTTLVFRAIGFVTGSDLSINVMTLGGIAVAMGELVDDAIVDVENIFRRLRENTASPSPRPALLVVYQASREIRSAIVFGTAVVIFAFLPLFALSGVEGRLFAPLGIAYVVSILASLLVSLTVTPVLSYYLLPQSGATHAHGDSPLLRALKWTAGHVIRFSMRHAGILLLFAWVAVGVSGWLLARLGTDFLPKFDEGSVQINVALPGGSSLKASNEASALIDAKLKTMLASPAQPDSPILHFARRTGRAELDEHAQPVSVGEYILTMNPHADYRRDEFLATLLVSLRAAVPGVEIDAEQPLSHLISHMLSGVNAQIAVKIYGDDLDKLRELAEQVRTVIAEVPGVTTPIIDPQERVDELHIVLRPDDLALFGVSREYVADFVQTALKGEAVSQVLEGQRRFDLVVKLKEPHRSDAYRLGELLVELPNGRGRLRLKEIADFPALASGPNLVNRENVQRKQVVRCNVSGRDLGGAAADIEERVRQRVPMPEGYFVEFGGQFEAQRSATLLIGILAGVSLGGIFIVLMMLYPSARISLQILNAIPTAFIGGVLALALTKQTLTVASLVGFVSLTGIAVRNGILLVTHYFHLMKEEGEEFTPHMILRGSLERLAPVLMTALTAGIGLVPLVVGGRKPGLEILYPVATVILGGLVTSTFCEFLIHPGLFWRFSGKDAERLVRSEGSAEELLRDAA